LHNRRRACEGSREMWQHHLGTCNQIAQINLSRQRQPIHIKRSPSPWYFAQRGRLAGSIIGMQQPPDCARAGGVGNGTAQNGAIGPRAQPLQDA
jgi:hypothetical protein